MTFKKVLFGIALLGTFALLACQPQPFRGYTYASTPVDGWDASDSLVFPIDTIRNAQDYQLSVGLRTSAAQPYPFQTLALLIEVHTNHPPYLAKDTLICSLTNKGGDINGRGVSLYQYEFPFDTIRWKPQTAGRITIRHIMRRTVIKGIANIGLSIKPLPPQ